MMTGRETSEAQDPATGELPPPPRLRDYTKLPLLIIAVMSITAMVLYPSLPASIPAHWGVSGAPDAFSTKSFASVFFEPMIALGIYVLLVVVPFFDPLRRSLKLSWRAYNIVIDAVVGMQAVVFGASMVAAYDNAFDVSKIVLISVGVLFAIIGNLMRSVTQNWTFGVRVRWTLSDDVVWRRTNRLGGYLFMAAGAITIVCAFLPAPFSILLMLGAVFGILVVTYVYSYLLYRKRHPEA